MPRGKKFTAEQIIGKLREAEVGLAQGKTVPEVVRKLGVTEQTYYRLEAGVRRAAYGPGEAAEGSREGERSVEAAPGGCRTRQGDPS
jgi:hypothetical protein